jgi:hypothetical protein
MKLSLNDVRNILVGETIASVTGNAECDEGLIITTETGAVLEIGFSSCEGGGSLNGQPIAL